MLGLSPQRASHPHGETGNMNSNTINDAKTVVGTGEGALLSGRFRVVRQLGRGGMGNVWLVEDTQLDDMRFAVKMLPSILVSNKRAYAQLKAEALVSLKLVHPNIVQLRAFEENDGNPFLVMDYVDGQTLDDYLAEKGTLSEDDVIRVLRPIAAALDYAHSKGVVHRDVKPANVMIRKDGVPFILDFGIAREIQETLTRVTGKLSSGTLLYMSPEQLNGARPKKEQDIYSFAAMAYECLKGEPPFARGQIEYQILNNTPSPIAGGPRSCVAAIMAGLAKKPEDRPPTCAAVLERPQRDGIETVKDIPEEDLRYLPPDARAQLHPAGHSQVSRAPAPASPIRKPAFPCPSIASQETKSDNVGFYAVIGMTIGLLLTISVCCFAKIKSLFYTAEPIAPTSYSTAAKNTSFVPRKPVRPPEKKQEKPMIYLTASIGGVRKNAHVFEGVTEKDVRKPVTITVNAAIGTKSYFAVQMMENGVVYSGVGEYVVKEGLHSLDVDMKPVKVCRNCGHRLPPYLQTAKCPRCLTNMLR